MTHERVLDNGNVLDDDGAQREGAVGRDREPQECEVSLRLYVTGQTPRSERAIGNLHRICAERFSNQCEIMIVDVLEQPQHAERDHIIVTPTLIRVSPLPSRRIIGDLSDTSKVLMGLGLCFSPPESRSGDA